MKKILIIRTDKIGDLILSTPVFESIKKNLKDIHLSVLINKNTIEIVKDNPYIDEIIPYDPIDSHKGIKGLFKLKKTLEEKKIDIAIHLFMSFKPSLAVFLSKIKNRIGPLSKFYSFIFLNIKIKQNRRDSIYNEAKYNLMLLKPLKIEYFEIKPKIYFSKEKAEEFKERYKINYPYIVIHPGMAGSAKNWPIKNYIELIKKILNFSNTNIVLTGNSNDSFIINSILSNIKENPKIKNFYSLLSLEEMKYLLFFSKAVFAPSTGPMHMAAALGKKTLSIFSPIKTQSETRWSPYLLDNVKILKPPVKCDFKKCNTKCKYYDCMQMITVDNVFDNLVKLINDKQ